MLSKTWLSILFFCLPGFLSAQPLRLHPDNPHYLLFQGNPALLVTSGEHYGAVLNDFDNLFYEICNEPWADNGVADHLLLKTLRPQLENMDWALLVEGASPATLDWQREMAQVVVTTERQLPKKHLIAQNYHNFKASLREVDPNIDIINFHYVWPEAVWMNYGWDRPLNFDESGFAGSADSTYLQQAWAFMLAGGAIFNNLDYSFFPGAENGTGVNDAPGGGSSALRRQLAFLRRFLESFDFIRLRPDRTVVRHAPGLDWQALSEPGRQYAFFLAGRPAGRLTLELPVGTYAGEWVAPETGATLSTAEFSSDGGPTALSFDHRSSMLALKITRQ